MAAITLPDGRGGWWHAYVCPAHGVELDHAGVLGGSFPAGGAPCRHGCRIDTPAVRGAWAVLAHQACARQIRSLATSSSPADRATAGRLLTEYAQRYAAATGPPEQTQPWMLPGRLFQQALTEAIWAVSIGSAAWALIDAGEPVGEPVRALLDALAAAATRSRAELVAQGRFTSNYTAWLNAAGAACSRKPEWLDGEYGSYAHVLAATGRDGWEWEGSTYYHQFVLRAYLLAVNAVAGRTPEAVNERLPVGASKRASVGMSRLPPAATGPGNPSPGAVDVPAPVTARLRAMAGVLRAIASPGGLLPALHDGPYARPELDRELAGLRSMLSTWDGPAADDGQRPAVELFQDVGYAVLRHAGIHAVVDFGPHGGSHGHRDKLALYLYGDTAAWQPDPGQVPYGHATLRSYYASSAAHPTFTVDGVEQAECAGSLISADSDSVVVGCDTAYPGVSARRQIALRDGALIDELTVAADRPSRITAHLRPGVDLQARTGGGRTTTTWSGPQLLTGWHECNVAAEFVCRPGYGTADDPQRTRIHVDWTARDVTAVTFRSSYRCGSE